MPDIRITKLTHACVRVSIGGIVLLIDPSTWSEPEEFVGADACLITHEHADHVDPDEWRKACARRRKASRSKRFEPGLDPRLDGIDQRPIKVEQHGARTRKTVDAAQMSSPTAR